MNALLLSAALALVPAAPLPKEAPLQWKLAKGDVFYTKTVTKSDQTITVMGNDMEQKSDQVVYHKYEVKDFSDKGLTLVQTVQKSTAKSDLPGMADTAEKMKGMVLTYILDSDYTVTKVEGVDKAIDSIAGDNEATKAMLKTTMSEDALKLGLSELFRVGPSKVVKVGDTWKKDYNLPLGPLGTFKLVSNYKYAEAGADADKVEYTAEGEFTLNKGDTGLGFSFSKGDLKTDSMSGDVLFDSKKGRLKSTSSKMKMSGTMAISANGTEIEMKLKNTTDTVVTVSDKSQADD